MFFEKETVLTNLYDSHVHWLSTGQIGTLWNLKLIDDPKDLLVPNPPRSYFQGSWLVGFGWDENRWPSEFRIHRSFLDQAFPQTPVFLSRTDGHSSWVNTMGLKKLGYWDLSEFPRDVEVDQDGVPTGVLRESAHIHGLFSLPPLSREEKRQHLIRGAEIFNQAGFSYIRDMTSNLEQWQIHQEIQNDLLLHVEHWFSCENFQDFSRALQQAVEARPQESDRMKVRGIKIFVDGSLGSETAFLSQPYQGHGQKGQLNWGLEEISEVFRSSWQKGFEVALHTLGDEAAHQVAVLARKLYAEGVAGRFHLEHAEVLRPETLQVLKSVHVRCHLQPCHWFSDRKWLEERLGKLSRYAFPWQALSRARIPISFGSDSPIESSSLFANLQALKESSKAGIPALEESPLLFHQYPYQDSHQKAFTTIREDRVTKIQFGDQVRLYS